MNQRRYGGYLVHAGIALLFAGAAASSAYDTRDDLRLSPGESATIGSYEVTYQRPTATLLDDPANTGAAITLGAALEVRRGDRRFALNPRRNYYPSPDIAGLGATGRFFDGNATSEIDIDTSPSRDLWTSIEPDIMALRPQIEEADRRFPEANARTQVVILSALVERYTRSTGEITVRLIVFPFVIWLYVGGLMLLAGAAVALWPRRVRRGSGDELAIPVGPPVREPDPVTA